MQYNIKVSLHTERSRNVMEINKIHNMNCIDGMQLLKDKSIDLVVTSPPYFNLRDYGVAGQIGQESTVDLYIERLMEVFDEVFRVLKDEGSCWVNIDDVYEKQSLIGIPDRFKIRMLEHGWILRNEIIWQKPNAMPSSAKNRFNGDFEKFFFFTKRRKYKFHTQYEPLKSAIPKKTANRGAGKYKNAEQEASVRQGMNKSRGEKLVFLRKNLPSQEQFVSFLRSHTTIDDIVENSELSKSKVEHWFRRDITGFSYPSVEDWNSIKWLVDDWSEEFRIIDEQLNDVTVETDDISKNLSNGRIMRAVWQINTKPFKGCHYAPYPCELVKTPIMACTSEGDIVLDPFIGSGTTAEVALKYNRNYIGFEINKEYCDVANTRINESSAKAL